MGKPFTKGGKDGDVGKGKDKGKKGDCIKGKVDGKGKDGNRPCEMKGIEKGKDGKGKDLITAKGKGIDGKGAEKGKKGLGPEAGSQKGIGLVNGSATAPTCLESKGGKGKGKDTVGKSQGGEMAEKGQPTGSALGSKDGKGQGKQGDTNGKSNGPSGQKGKGKGMKGGTPAPTGTVAATPTPDTKDVVTTPAKSNTPSGQGGGLRTSVTLPYKFLI